MPQSNASPRVTASSPAQLTQVIHLDPIDLEGLVRPLLESLAKLARLESVYLTVFDWNRSEQEVRFAFSADETEVKEGHRIAIPAGLSPEAFPGVTRSPRTVEPSQADSLIARGLGLKAYVSVPVTIAKHRLYGMLCGASRKPQELSENVIALFESFARIVADQVTRLHLEHTEERLARAEGELLIRAKMLAETEHRFKTPLTVLEGTALTLRDRDEQLSRADRMELQQSMVRNIHFLNKEVEHLLIEARADVALRELSPVNFDLEPMVEEIATAFGGLESDHRVLSEWSEGIPAFVDPTAIYHVLGHLLDNAIKYSPNGGTIKIHASEKNGCLSIDVTDQGVGLPPGVDLFAPYRRGDSGDRHVPGIGLGLHIVRTLVEAMKGTVVARTNPSGGSTFTVCLPAANVREGVRAQAIQPPPRGLYE